MSTPSPTAQKLTATNFDLPSLHLLRPEIEVTLHDAEIHLSEFNDDHSQAPLLLDSVETLAQVANVLCLIQLQEGYELACCLSKCFQKLYDQRDQDNNAMMMDVSEGIMTLARYIEFVLLKETIEPSLLLPIVNTLHACLDESDIGLSALTNSKDSSIVIANPEQNYQSLKSLGIDQPNIIKAYRAGLHVVLTAANNQLTTAQQVSINAMQAACEAIAQRSTSLFWQAADAAVSNVAESLPLSDVQKRALIFVEQQLQDYLPINDARFADLVKFASSRNGALAQQVQQQFSKNALDHDQLTVMKRFLFGLDREVAITLNQIIQDEIDLIKTASDTYARQENLNASEEEIHSIVERLHDLSGVFTTLSLAEAAAVLKAQIQKVESWTAPTPQDFDQLLASLMVAENAAIHLAKSHTPGAVNVSLYNKNTSLHQLDTAYITLIQESRTAVATIESAFHDYLNDADHDLMHLTSVPDIMRTIAGACLFLNLAQQSQLLNRGSQVMQQLLQDHTQQLSAEQLAKVADIVMATDYYLESLEVNKPAGNHAMQVGYKSLQCLMAA